MTNFKFGKLKMSCYSLMLVCSLILNQLLSIYLYICDKDASEEAEVLTNKYYTNNKLHDDTICNSIKKQKYSRWMFLFKKYRDEILFLSGWMHIFKMTFNRIEQAISCMSSLYQIYCNVFFN